MARKINYQDNLVGNFQLLGFATGSYYCICSNCEIEFLGDKRSCQCLKCAIKNVEEKLKSPNKQSDAVALCVSLGDAIIKRGYVTVQADSIHGKHLEKIAQQHTS